MNELLFCKRLRHLQPIWLKELKEEVVNRKSRKVNSRRMTASLNVIWPNTYIYQVVHYTLLGTAQGQRIIRRVARLSSRRPRQDLPFSVMIFPLT